jgi:hypothetical protein
MRRVVAVLLTVASVVAAAVLAIAFAGSPHGSAQHPAARRGVLPTLPGSVSVVRFQKFGGAYKCDGDSCSVGGSVSGNGFTLPVSPTAYRSTLTVSFRYRASGKDARFAVRAFVSNASSGHAVANLPASRPVLSTGGSLASTTLVFKPAALSGGTNYTFQIRPTLTHHLTRAQIVVTQVVYSLQAWLG